MSYFLEIGENCLNIRKLDMDKIDRCLKIHFNFKIVTIYSHFRKKSFQIQDYQKQKNN